MRDWVANDVSPVDETLVTCTVQDGVFRTIKRVLNDVVGGSDNLFQVVFYGARDNRRRADIACRIPVNFSFHPASRTALFMFARRAGGNAFMRAFLCRIFDQGERHVVRPIVDGDCNDYRFHDVRVIE